MASTACCYYVCLHVEIILLSQMHEFLSASVQLAVNTRLAVWCKIVSRIDILVIKNEGSEGLYDCVCALREVLKDHSNILVSNTKTYNSEMSSLMFIFNKF